MANLAFIRDIMVRKLAARSPLDANDIAAIAALPLTVRELKAGAYLVRDGEPSCFCIFLSSGFTVRQKVTINGARQIVSIQMQGDFIDLENMFLKRSDHSVQSLTATIVVEIPREAMRDLARGRSGVAQAMWIDTLVDASVFREWVVNVGRRDAKSRIAHLLCEVDVRLEAAGVGSRGTYILPMTQEQIGDAVGLTSVHVNRTLRILCETQLIARHGLRVTILNRAGLHAVAGFNPDYLHLDQVD